MKQKDILFLLISTFVVVVAWIGFNLYHKWATSTISADLQIQIKPIAPDFDQATVEKIRTRNHVAPLYQLKTVVPSTTVVPTQPAPSAVPIIQPETVPTGQEPTVTEENPTAEPEEIPIEQP